MSETVECITDNWGVERLNQMLSGEIKFNPYCFHLQGRTQKVLITNYTVIQPGRQLSALSPSQETKKK